MNFITRSGSEFRDGTRRYRFIGANQWDLSKVTMTTANCIREVQYAYQDGIRVSRILIAGNQANNTGNYRYLDGSNNFQWREAGFLQLDRALYELGLRGMRAILVLSDQFNYGPDIGVYCEWSNTLYGTAYNTDPGYDFYTDTHTKQWYKDYISQFVNRVNTISGVQYKNDPAIFAWELINEARYSAGVDTNANTANSARIQTLSAWQAEMTAYIKSIDTNHLVSVGDTGGFYDAVANDHQHTGSAGGRDYINQPNDPNTDFYDFHIYPYSSYPTNTLAKYGIWATGGSTASENGFIAQIDEYVAVAKAHNKPVVWSEMGIDARNSDNDLLTSYPRKESYRKIFDMFFNRGGDGLCIWFYKTISESAGVYIYPLAPHSASLSYPAGNWDDTTTRQLMARYASSVLGRRIPVS